MHECDGPSRLNSRPRRYLFTGHSNGTVQLWDLTTALDLKQSEQSNLGGPNANEFVKLLDQCDLATNSGYSTPTTTLPTPTTTSCTSPNSNLISKFNKNLLINSSLTSSNSQQYSDDMNERKAD